MFGYAKGAFTGAYAKRIGRIEMAQKGTLFLDEIGELSLDMQSKLLQVMEESSFERVGDARSINVDIRVLSATNIDLETSLAQGRLRRDLFYRLPRSRYAFLHCAIGKAIYPYWWTITLNNFPSRG